MHKTITRRSALLALLSAAGTGCGVETAPDIAFTLLDGTPGSFAALRSKVVLVNFWATSCTTCVKEMPQMVAAHRQFAPRGFELLAVSMSYDAPANVAHFAQTRQLPFKVVIDNTGAIARAFGDVKLTPTSLLLDKRGAIVMRHLGEPDFAALHTKIDALLRAA